jgi:hypothetical protein
LEDKVPNEDWCRLIISTLCSFKFSDEGFYGELKKNKEEVAKVSGMLLDAIESIDNLSIRTQSLATALAFSMIDMDAVKKPPPPDRTNGQCSALHELHHKLDLADSFGDGSGGVGGLRRGVCQDDRGGRSGKHYWGITKAFGGSQKDGGGRRH